MIASLKKKGPAKFPRSKIRQAVQRIMPKGKTFRLQVAESSVGKLKIVRVITPAWKKLRPPERIGKVLDAVSGELTSKEQKGILRFSVLTPEEYNEVVLRKG